MKLNKKQLAWYAGSAGSGGGGGTSCCYEAITVAALQALKASTSLEAGKHYLITDVTPDWEVIVMATSTAEVTTQGDAIYQNVLFCEAFYDLDTNTILKIYDPTNFNEVEGDQNIAVFQWNNALWNGNIIVENSSLIYPSGTVTNFQNNTLLSNSQIDITDATIANVIGNTLQNGATIMAMNAQVESVSYNLISQGASIDCFATTSLFGIDYNVLNQSSALSVSSATLSGHASNNTLSGSSNITIDTAVDEIVNNTLGNNSYITITTGSSSLSIRNNILGGQSSIVLVIPVVTNVWGNTIYGGGQIAGTRTEAVDISYNLITNGTTNFTNTIFTVGFTANILENGSIVDTSGSAPASKTVINDFSYNLCESYGYILVGDPYHGGGACSYGNIRYNKCGGYNSLGLAHLRFTGTIVIGNIEYNNIQGSAYLSVINSDISGDVSSNKVIDTSLIEFRVQSVISNITYNSLSEGSTITGDTTALNDLSSNSLSSSTMYLDSFTSASDISYNALQGLSNLNCNGAVVNNGVLDNRINDGSALLIGAVVLRLQQNNITSGSLDLTLSNIFGLVDNNYLSQGNITAVLASIAIGMVGNNVGSGCSLTIDGGTFDNVNYNTLYAQGQINVVSCSITSLSNNVVYGSGSILGSIAAATITTGITQNEVGNTSSIIINGASIREISNNNLTQQSTLTLTSSTMLDVLYNLMNGNSSADLTSCSVDLFVGNSIGSGATVSAVSFVAANGIQYNTINNFSSWSLDNSTIDEILYCLSIGGNITCGASSSIGTFAYNSILNGSSVTLAANAVVFDLFSNNYMNDGCAVNLTDDIHDFDGNIVIDSVVTLTGNLNTLFVNDNTFNHSTIDITDTLNPDTNVVTINSNQVFSSQLLLSDILINFNRNLINANSSVSITVTNNSIQNNYVSASNFSSQGRIESAQGNFIVGNSNLSVNTSGAAANTIENNSLMSGSQFSIVSPMGCQSAAYNSLTASSVTLQSTIDTIQFDYNLFYISTALLVDGCATYTYNTFESITANQIIYSHTNCRAVAGILSTFRADIDCSTAISGTTLDLSNGNNIGEYIGYYYLFNVPTPASTVIDGLQAPPTAFNFRIWTKDLDAAAIIDWTNSVSLKTKGGNVVSMKGGLQDFIEFFSPNGDNVYYEYNSGIYV